MPGESRATTAHTIIRRWTEDRGGIPSTRRENGHAEVGSLQIRFPQLNGDGAYEELDWETFFEEFDKSNLVMVFQEENGRGDRSHFYRFFRREERAFAMPE